MFFIIFIICLCGILGYLSYRINVLKKGAKEFLPQPPKNLFKLLIYLALLLLIYLSNNNDFYNLLILFLALNLLAHDLNKEIRENYAKIIASTPPALIKITLMLISVLVITEINKYITTTVGLAISNFSIALTSITFLFTLAYFGSLMLLGIALLIEIKLISLLFKTEKVANRMRMFLYNLLTDNHKIKIKTAKNEKSKNYLDSFIPILQLVLTLHILLSKNFIDNPNKTLERIVISIAYSDIYQGCNNIMAQPFLKMMFIDLNNVSLATPNWNTAISITQREEQHIENYLFSHTTCRKLSYTDTPNLPNK